MKISRSLRGCGRGLSKAVWVACLAAVLPVCSALAAQPFFDPGPCPFAGGADLSKFGVSCGYLVVPESRSRPDGPIVRLAVLKYRSKATSPQPDPVLFLAGGPGVASLAGGRAWENHPLLGERDLILLDQRGTGYSEPAFCRDLGEKVMLTMAADLTPC